nr:VENN motif pre-toxin domain-containing protein [Snodgrassella gandavensis]
MKANIRDLSSAVATVSGGLTGGSLVNAQIAGVAGQNAVENNQLGINHQQSDQKAIKAFNQKVKKELGNKFELKGTGKMNLLGYEIMELVPIGDNSISSLSQAELDFYNMLNSIIKDPTGTAQIVFIYDNNLVDGGSWVTGQFDVGDMEKLDKSGIIMNGNTLIAHEFNEQLDKNKLGLNPYQGKNDTDYISSHEKAKDHEDEILPKRYDFIGENMIIDGKKYTRIYKDNLTGKYYGINTVIPHINNGREEHEFKPTQNLIKINKDGTFIYYLPQNPNKPEIYPPR